MLLSSCKFWVPHACHPCLFSFRDSSYVSVCSTSPQSSPLPVCLQILQSLHELPDRAVLEQLIWDLPLQLVDWIDEAALYCAVLQVGCSCSLLMHVSAAW